MIRIPQLETRDAGGKPWQSEMDVRFERRNLTEDGSFEGYGSVFNVLEESYGTKFQPGAFSQSLADYKRTNTMPKLLWQHNPAAPIGAYKVVSEDSRGLWVKGKLTLEVQQAKEAYALMRDDALDGLSIGFVTIQSESDSQTGIRTITQADLWEVSIVTFPANRAASVDNVRASERVKTERDFERFLRDEGGYSHTRARTIASRGFKAASGSRDGDGSLSDLMASLRAATQSLS